jgi:hypothetical protein
MATSSQVARAAIEIKPPVGDRAIDGAYVRSIPDATPQQWRQFGIRVCDYAITHGLTRDELLENLRVLGVLADGTPAVARDPIGRPRRQAGRCGECGRSVGLTVTGRLYGHSVRSHGGGRCDGSGRAPVAAPESEAVAP